MIVEDGTGLMNANSFVDIAYSDTYFSLRGYSQWGDLTDEQKEVFLIRGSEYVNYAFDYYGKKMNPTQSLKFPRVNLLDEDGESVVGIPCVLKEAVCECAKIISNGSDMFQVQDANGAITSESIGSLSFSYDLSRKIKDSSLYDTVNLRLRGLYKDKSTGKIISGDMQRV